MKSPFVRFSRFVRTPLSIATVGLCTVWGCRQVPGSRHSCDEHRECDSVAATEFGDARGHVEYEEKILANPISPDATEPPLVSLSEADSAPLTAPMKTEVATPMPEVDSEPQPATKPAEEPMPVAEAPQVEKTIEPDDEPTAKPNSSTLELPEDASDTPRRKTPAPAPKFLEDEFFPDLPESTPKLELPPEPAPPTVEESPTTEAQAKPQPQPAAKELAELEIDKAVELFTSVPKPVSVREKELVPVVDNELLSLDSYCDGLVVDAQGFGYVSHRNRIVKFSPTGETSIWTTLSSPKGHRIEPEGTHLVCDVERREIVRLSFDGKVVGVAAKTCNGTALRAPYDIAVDPKGGFYFTDPGYVQIKNPIGKLHYVDRSGQVSIVVAKLGYPTGIAFDPARQRVLVAESHFNRIVEFRLSEPGQIESHEVLVQLPKSPESEYHLANLCLDSEGNLYVTQSQTKTVQVFDPQGQPLGRFSTGAVVPSSVALRSPDAAELFLTGDVEGRTRTGKVIRLNLGK